jgi:hypothetical protein
MGLMSCIPTRAKMAAAPKPRADNSARMMGSTEPLPWLADSQAHPVALIATREFLHPAFRVSRHTAAFKPNFVSRLAMMGLSPLKYSLVGNTDTQLSSC